MSEYISDRCSGKLLNVFNNRKLAALATALTLGACAAVVPQTHAATLGENLSGVCSFKLNAAENEVLQQIKSKSASFDENEAWRLAFEDAFPQARAVAEEFWTQWKTDPTFLANTQRDTLGAIDKLGKRVEEAANSPEQSSKKYAESVWSKVGSSGFESQGRASIWAELEAQLAEGTIQAAPRRFRAQEPSFPVLPKDQEGLVAKALTYYPDLSRGQAVAIAQAFEKLDGVNELRVANDFEAALNTAKIACRDGKVGAVLFPTNGSNPDELSQGLTAPARDEKDKDNDKKVDGNPTIIPGQSDINITVLPAEPKEPKPDEEAQETPASPSTVTESPRSADNEAALIGGIVGTIVVAILAVIGLNAANIF